VPTWLLGTIDGSILVMASLPPKLYALVERVQVCGWMFQPEPGARLIMRKSANQWIMVS
jgi:hypothetical protein